jgi:hypothetical protein
MALDNSGLKVCCSCKIGKEYIYFSKYHKSKDGLKYSCKECINKKYKLFTENNPIGHKLKKENCKNNYIKNKNNPENILKNKIYVEKNKEKIVKRQKEYRIKNADILIIKKRE